MTKPDGSPVEAAGAWLLSVLDGGGWAEAEAIEAEREAAGVSARALTTARGRLVQDGRIEKHKAGRGACATAWRGGFRSPGRPRSPWPRRPVPGWSPSRRGSRRRRASGRSGDGGGGCP